MRDGKHLSSPGLSPIGFCSRRSQCVWRSGHTRQEVRRHPPCVLGPRPKLSEDQAWRGGWCEILFRAGPEPRPEAFCPGSLPDSKEGWLSKQALGKAPASWHPYGWFLARQLGARPDRSRIPAERGVQAPAMPSHTPVLHPAPPRAAVLPWAGPLTSGGARPQPVTAFLALAAL